MAGKNLGSLVFDIQADVAGLRKDMQKGERVIKGSTDRMKKHANSVKSAFKGIAIAGAAIGAGAAVIGRIVNRQRELIDNQAKMASAVGLTSAQLAGYRLGAELSGVSTGQLDAATTKFIKSIGDAGNGLQAPIRALKALGLTFDELNGKTTDEQLKLVAERFGGLEGTVARNTVAMDLFGRSGAKVVKMFENGAEGIKSFQQEAKELGLAISEIDAKKVEGMNDALSRAQAAVSGVGAQLTITLAPILQEMAEDFALAAKESGGFKAEIDAIKGAAELAAEALRVLIALRELDVKAQEWVNNDLWSFDNSGRDDVLNAQAINEEKLNKALEKREILLTTMLGLSKETVAERQKEIDLLDKEIKARKASKDASANSPATWEKIRGLDAASAEESQTIAGEQDAAKKAEEAAAKALAAATKETELAMKGFQSALESAREAVNASGPKLTAENVQYSDLSRLTSEARIASVGGDNDKALRLAEEGAKAAQLLKESGKESGLVISGALKALETIAAKAIKPDEKDTAKKEPIKAELTIKAEITSADGKKSVSFNGDDQVNGFLKQLETVLQKEAAAVGG